MALSCGIPEAIDVIKLAMQLYDNFISIFGNAKRDFALFSRELASLKSTLEGIRKECGSGGSLMIHSDVEERRGIIADLEEAVSFTTESLTCWNKLLKNFGGRPQNISWKIWWARKYPSLIQCRDRIHVQSKLLEIVMLRIHTSQNFAIISEIKQLGHELRAVVPPLPVISDTEKTIQEPQSPTAESSQGARSRSSTDVQSVAPASIATTHEEEEEGIEATDYSDEVKSILQSVQDRISQLLLRNRQISCQPQIPENTPPVEFAELFQKSALLSDYKNSPPAAWLRVGTWWLLKSIKLSELLGSNHSAMHHVNLLKASWILYSQLGMNDIQSPETQEMIESLRPEERTLLENLASAIGHHTKGFRGVSVPSVSSLDPASFAIWERIAHEELDTGSIFEHALDSHRWITIKDEHAGSDNEEVLYRSFVQAQIGCRAMRLLVEDTDYLLVLVVPSEQTEPIMVLSNQAGTMNLSCSSFQWANEGSMNDTTNKMVVPFGKRAVPITFKNSDDYKKFTTLAHEYFDAVKDREPSDFENEIYRRVLQDYSKRNVNSSRQSIQPQLILNHDSRYWELRVHEMNSDQYWQKVRRLVISDCAREKNPKCTSFFLPMSWVYVSVNPLEPLEVTIKWSDCNQKDTFGGTGGNFDHLITYKWIPDSPNHSINVKFLNENDAIMFSEIILSLNVCKISKELLGCWSYHDPKYHLYRVRNTKKGTGPETYKYLVVTKSESVPTMDMEEIWKRSEVYFFGREIDYIIDENYSRIELENLYSPLYLSNHVNMPQDAHGGSSVAYSHTEAKLGGVAFSIDVAAQSTEDLQPQLSHTTLQGERWVVLDRPTLDTEKEFLTALSDGWSVILSMKVVCIEYAEPRFLDLMKKLKKIPVYLQVWRENSSAGGVPATERLVARQITSSSSSGDLPWISVEGMMPPRSIYCL
ncbi:uncharacterized protein H6S33_001483 [Morchella sextelata]|uniref:uncharacterized protein n=1 Tax=Morchella sextelata TaxID=1174677 RepID=UPI001D03C3BF|nr:uncharacterized protein H6S33_001483 [Morchella sextelata]KAH0608349.1 hypothetical protein H6S33_001483 [Morchella sextelata]